MEVLTKPCPELRDFLSSDGNDRFVNIEQDIKLISSDKTISHDVDIYYIYMTWASRILAKTKPQKHIDISSSLYFSVIASDIIPIDFYEYHPVELEIEGLQFQAADLLSLPFEDNSVKSLSSMHVVEHVGLGRCGDSIDANGDLKAISELKRVLAEGGDLLFVVPIGRQRIMFNTHRIYSYEQIMSYFQELELVEFSLVPDVSKQGSIVKDPPAELVVSQNYGCGCFWFRKPDALNKDQSVNIPSLLSKVQREVVLRVKGGLCNRLRALVSAKIFAEDTSRNLKLIWIKDEPCYCNLVDLFKEGLVVESGHTDNNVVSSAKYGYGDELVEAIRSVTDADPDKVSLELCTAFNVTMDDGEEFEKRFSSELNSMVPRDFIMSNVMDVPGNTIGVHIRRTDQDGSIKHSPDEVFIEKMDQIINEDPSCYFFLCSDDAETKRSFIDRYRDRMLVYDGTEYSRETVTSIQIALIELLTLSRTKMILGSAFSSYSEVASKFNMIPLEFLRKKF